MLTLMAGGDDGRWRRWLMLVADWRWPMADGRWLMADGW